MNRLPLLTVVMLCACPPPHVDDAGAEEEVDASVTVSPPDDGGTGTPDGGKGPFMPGTQPSGPVPGEVTWWQLELPVGLIPKTGEAGVLVGPDGTLVLVDVGNSKHDDEVLAAVRELNTTWLTPQRGYRQRGETEVDWVVLTHFHADHVGAFGPLAGVLNITRGVIHRGFVDVGPGTNEADFETVCTQLRGALATRDVPVCTANPESACAVGAHTGHGLPRAHARRSLAGRRRRVG